jgi:hypothetical protein
VPAPTLIACAIPGSNPTKRRVASLLIGIAVCTAGVVFALWGWFLYIPAGLILLIAAGLSAREHV